MCTKWPTSSRISQRPPGGRNWQHALGIGAPAHLLRLVAEDAEERHRQARQLQHRPLGAPRAEAAEAHRRVDLPAPAVGVLAGADRCQVAAATPATGAGSSSPAARPAPRACPACGCWWPCAGDGRASPATSLAIIWVRSCSATSGTIGAYGSPSRLTKEAEPVRLGVGELDHHPAALGVPDDRQRLSRADVVEHRQRVAEVGVPRVQRGVVAVAVAALVPAHDPPPGGRQQGGEDVVRPGEVEAAVHAQQRRGVGVTPLVGREPEPVGVDAVLAIGRAGAWEGDLGDVHATTLPTGPPLVDEPAAWLQCRWCACWEPRSPVSS